MIAFVRSGDINPDPRVSKYIDTIENCGIEYLVFGWDRQKLGLEKENYIYFRKKASYGAKYRNYLNKAIWMLFIFVSLILRRKRIRIVHAADFDSALPSMLFCIFCRKKLIFDIYDWIGTNSKKEGLLIRIVEYLENLIVRKSEVVILPELERVAQLSPKSIINKKILIMPNIPNVLNIEKNKSAELSRLNHRKEERLVISYVGVFDYNRGIENLLKASENLSDLLVLIAGYGALEKKITAFASVHKNIKFMGKVDYSKALEIIQSSDLLYACYHMKNPVHKYAAPNKYYESLYCRTPIITNKGTLLSNRVENYGTGFVIGETLADLVELLSKRELPLEIDKKAKNCEEVWEGYYKGYIASFLRDEYMPIISRLGMR